MKKQLLSFFAIACGSVMFAQVGETPVEGTQISETVVNELNRQSQERLNNARNDREEINGWVSFELTQYLQTYGEDAFYTYGQVISPDSLQRVSFTGGVFRSFTHSFGQMFDPTASDMDNSDAMLTPADAYVVDSVGLPCIYRRVNHNGIDDTLIITVAVTDKETSGVNPYDGSYFWNAGGLLAVETSAMAPSYLGDPADGYHYGLTGVSDAGTGVDIQTYKFALTDADTELFWKSFPVNVSAGPDQVVYTMVEFKPSYETSIDDTVFVFDGAEGEADVNSFRTIYDFPQTEEAGFFFDLYRDDQFTYNTSYVAAAETRYMGHTGDNAWRNNRLDAYSLWGFRFEYYMNATSSVGIEETENKANFSLFPNPANGDVTITVADENITNAQIEVQDLAGRVIYTAQMNGTQQVTLNTGNLGLASGVYVVVLATTESKYSQKLIVE